MKSKYKNIYMVQLEKFGKKMSSNQRAVCGICFYKENQIYIERLLLIICNQLLFAFEETMMEIICHLLKKENRLKKAWDSILKKEEKKEMMF